MLWLAGDVRAHAYSKEQGMKFPLFCSGLCGYTEGWGGKCSEILATVELLYNPRVNKVFTHSLHSFSSASHDETILVSLPCDLSATGT